MRFRLHTSSSVAYQRLENSSILTGGSTFAWTTYGDSPVVSDWCLADNWVDSAPTRMHANLSPISHVLPQLAGIITGRGLQTVTLNDVFA